MGALKKPCDKSQSTSLKQLSETTDTNVQKAEIERMKRLVTEKIKDPQLAKKAAMIISEMLNSKT